MSAVILVVVVFMGNNPVDGGLQGFPDKATCEAARALVMENAKAKATGYSVYTECREVRVPPVIKAPPPKPEAGSQS